MNTLDGSHKHRSHLASLAPQNEMVVAEATVAATAAPPRGRFQNVDPPETRLRDLKGNAAFGDVLSGYVHPGQPSGFLIGLLDNRSGLAYLSERQGHPCEGAQELLKVRIRQCGVPDQLPLMDTTHRRAGLGLTGLDKPTWLPFQFRQRTGPCGLGLPLQVAGRGDRLPQHDAMCERQ